MTFDNPDHYDSLFLRLAGERGWLKVPLCEVCDKADVDAEHLTTDLVTFKSGEKFTRAEFCAKLSALLSLRIVDFAILPYGYTSTPEVSAFLEKYS